MRRREQQQLWFREEEEETAAGGQGEKEDAVGVWREEQHHELGELEQQNGGALTRMTRRLRSPLSGWLCEVRRWLEMVEGWRSEGGDGSMMVDAGDGAVARLRWMDGVGGGEWWRAVVLVVMVMWWERDGTGGGAVGLWSRWRCWVACRHAGLAAAAAGGGRRRRGKEGMEMPGMKGH